MSQSGKPMFSDFITESQKKSFWDRVKINSQEKCWEWTAAKTGDRFNYGKVGFNGKTYQTHRVAFVLHNGTIPSGALICHKCDNPPCCNPNHLFCGTSKQNVADSIKKGRFKCLPDKPTGCVLTVDQVKEIKNDIKNWYYGWGKAKATQYGVHTKTIYDILHNISWKGISL